MAASQDQVVPDILELDSDNLADMRTSKHQPFIGLRFATRHERNIFFLRHGEYEHHNGDDASQVLTEKGKKQANAVGQFLADHVEKARLDPVIIYHSTLTRSIQTTEIVHSHLPQATVMSTPLLREVSFNPRGIPVFRNPSHLKRAEEALQTLVNRATPTATTTIFSIHANLIMYFMSRICNESQEMAVTRYNRGYKHCGLTHLSLSPEGWPAVMYSGHRDSPR